METRINTGAIFKNDNKKAENHPDYKGKVNVNGKEMEVALWMKTSSKDSWIVFAARPDAVIRNMLTDPSTNKIEGRMEIVSIVPITKDTVEYTVYVHVNETESNENPEVRKLLQSDPKK